MIIEVQIILTYSVFLSTNWINFSLFKAFFSEIPKNVLLGRFSEYRHQPKAGKPTVYNLIGFLLLLGIHDNQCSAKVVSPNAEH